VHTEESIAMGEVALAAVRSKPRSSIRVALDLVARGQAGAAVSAGHTGACVVEAVREWGLFPGLDRPALAVSLPRADGGSLLVLDIGANVDCRPEHLANFAVLGQAWSAAHGVAQPRLGLLSNGEEDTKGNAVVKSALARIRSMGYLVRPIEPRAALSGGCDVLVCDGFVGNVVLKTIEATAEAVRAILGRDAGDDSRERLVSWDRYGGALLLGVPQVLVVAHGRATVSAVTEAISRAADAAFAQAPARLARALAAVRLPET
jgi:glycerol-3-phosphate acyltransferase PlsX